MNKEQIAKHGKVIIWFATGNNADKGVWFKQDNSDWVRTTNPTFNVGNYDLVYVQNDNYSDLRKALADGKTIQASVDTKACWEKILSPVLFNLPVSRYRIKPEEPKFKVGDWVRNNKTIFWIRQLKEEDLNAYNGMEGYVNLGKEFELWEPQEREWCVFWNSKHMHYAIGQYFQTQGNNDYMKFGDLSSYNNIAPLEFAQTLKAK